jgi:hypothetical protein
MGTPNGNFTRFQLALPLHKTKIINKTFLTMAARASFVIAFSSFLLLKGHF